ncbi:hypothetical protein cypCar_00048915, partial [Cyprinus carpio]
VDAFSAAVFATTSCARMISSNTRRAVRSWKQRLLNVYLVIVSVNILVSDARHVSVTITLEAKCSNRRKEKLLRAQSVDMKLRRPKISACPPEHTNLAGRVALMKMIMVHLDTAPIGKIRNLEEATETRKISRRMTTLTMIMMMTMKMMMTMRRRRKTTQRWRTLSQI